MLKNVTHSGRNNFFLGWPRGPKTCQHCLILFPEQFPPGRGGLGAPRAKIIFRRFSTKSARPIIVVSPHARTHNKYSSRAASTVETSRAAVALWARSAEVAGSNPDGDKLVFAFFILFGRNQCIALQQMWVVQIKPLQQSFCTNTITLIQLPGHETTRYTPIYVRKNFGGFAPEPPIGVATVNKLFITVKNR
jgi:hypothetical protein